MPRKRRFPKRRAPLPEGLERVSGLERTLWATRGPLLEGDVVGPAPDGYFAWPDWPTWANFYATVRDELYATCPLLRESSTAERLFLAIRSGEDVDAVRDALESDCDDIDPRRLVGVDVAS